jgi:hypothetical protein
MGNHGPKPNRGPQPVPDGHIFRVERGCPPLPLVLDEHLDRIAAQPQGGDERMVHPARDRKVRAEAMPAVRASFRSARARVFDGCQRLLSNVGGVPGQSGLLGSRLWMQSGSF